MLFNYLTNIIEIERGSEAIVWHNTTYTYAWLKLKIEQWKVELNDRMIGEGTVVALQGDFSPNAIALLIALIQRCCIIVPIATKIQLQQEEYCRIAQVQYLLTIDKNDQVKFSKHEGQVKNVLLLKLKEKQHPGLIIFSSGSTGKSKAAVHDFIPLLEKFKQPKRRMRTIAFLLFDHIGGINTLFYTLFNGGCLIVPVTRTPQQVCDAIARFHAQALTTTPTFLNLLLISGMIENYDLSSLRVINYGTEVMQEATLNDLHTLLPNVRLSQAYGLSEVGVLPVRSKSSDSVYFKIDNDGFNTRIVDGLLEIKSHSFMLGYLNAPNPFTEDGWFKTGDAIETNGEYLRVLGRKSELINVGGEKVYPVEIENILQQIQGVDQVAVFSEANAIIGQIIVARIKLKVDEPLSDFRPRLYAFCKTRLPGYKIPQKIILTNDVLYNERFKKIRLTGVHNEN
ncbi:MAG: long-chain fatty acid--CoA ligase [Gammaproteobacteria bacterium]|nr:long-chain fatty acid--CoA ligase [Gammaproteobacteria bacterium]